MRRENETICIIDLYRDVYIQQSYKVKLQKSGDTVGQPPGAEIGVSNMPALKAENPILL